MPGVRDRPVDSFNLIVRPFHHPRDGSLAARRRQPFGRVWKFGGNPEFSALHRRDLAQLL
jgi:hypothetical protein